jgi:hypothetical protein
VIQQRTIRTKSACLEHDAHDADVNNQAARAEGACYLVKIAKLESKDSDKPSLNSPLAGLSNFNIGDKFGTINTPQDSHLDAEALDVSHLSSIFAKENHITHRPRPFHLNSDDSGNEDPQYVSSDVDFNQEVFALLIIISV